MAYLLDTTILGRLANASDVQHAVAARAVLELHRRGEVLHVTPQVLVEFRNVATRPVSVNGLGLSPVDTEALATTYEARFPMLSDMPDVYPAWKEGAGSDVGGDREAGPRCSPRSRLPCSCSDTRADVQRRTLRSAGQIWARYRGR